MHRKRGGITPKMSGTSQSASARRRGRAKSGQQRKVLQLAKQLAATLGSDFFQSIVKHLAAAHNGAVRVESRPKEGSTFYFTLPAAAGSTPVG